MSLPSHTFLNQRTRQDQVRSGTSTPNALSSRLSISEDLSACHLSSNLNSRSFNEDRKLLDEWETHLSAQSSREAVEPRKFENPATAFDPYVRPTSVPARVPSANAFAISLCAGEISGHSASRTPSESNSASPFRYQTPLAGVPTNPAALSANVHINNKLANHPIAQQAAEHFPERFFIDFGASGPSTECIDMFFSSIAAWEQQTVALQQTQRSLMMQLDAANLSAKRDCGYSISPPNQCTPSKVSQEAESGPGAELMNELKTLRQQVQVLEERKQHLARENEVLRDRDCSSADRIAALEKELRGPAQQHFPADNQAALEKAHADLRVLRNLMGATDEKFEALTIEHAACKEALAEAKKQISYQQDQLESLKRADDRKARQSVNSSPSPKTFIDGRYDETMVMRIEALERRVDAHDQKIESWTRPSSFSSGQNPPYSHLSSALYETPVCAPQHLDLETSSKLTKAALPSFTSSAGFGSGSGQVISNAENFRRFDNHY